MYERLRRYREIETGYYKSIPVNVCVYILHSMVSIPARRSRLLAEVFKEDQTTWNHENDRSFSIVK